MDDDYYDDYDDEPEIDKKKLIIGATKIGIQIIALSSITVFCNNDSNIAKWGRETSALIYGWLKTYVAFGIVIGIIGIILGFFPPTAFHMPFIYSIPEAGISILMGIFMTTFVGMTLAAVKDSSCNTHQSTAIKVIMFFIIKDIVTTVMSMKK